MALVFRYLLMHTADDDAVLPTLSHLSADRQLAGSEVQINTPTETTRKREARKYKTLRIQPDR